MLLSEKSIHKKLTCLDDTLELALTQPDDLRVPELPGRDIEYLPINHLTGRIGISTSQGQQKLLHDLANIELQAMELGLRTLIEFPWAPEEFRQNLVVIIQEEAKHLKMCLEGLEVLGGHWGQWPVHLGLWHSTHKKDSLLERIFIVHRYLEGSGLDAGDTLLRRLSGVPNKVVKQVVQVIVDEEVGHVRFGSHWYKHYMEKFKFDEKIFFETMCLKLMKRHPRKDKICFPLREQALFEDQELAFLQEIR